MKLTRKAIYTTHELLSQRNSIERTNKQSSVTSLNVSWNSEDKGDSDDNEKMKKADEFFLKIQFTKFFCQQIWFQELFIGCSEFPAPLTVKTGEENFHQYCIVSTVCVFYVGFQCSLSQRYFFYLSTPAIQKSNTGTGYGKGVSIDNHH